MGDRIGMGGRTPLEKLEGVCHELSYSPFLTFKKPVYNFFGNNHVHSYNPLSEVFLLMALFLHPGVGLISLLQHYTTLLRAEGCKI